MTDDIRAKAERIWARASKRDARIYDMMELSHRDRAHAVRILRAAGLSLRAAGDVLGVSRTTIAKYDTTDES